MKPFPLKKSPQNSRYLISKHQAETQSTLTDDCVTVEKNIMNKPQIQCSEWFSKHLVTVPQE